MGAVSLEAIDTSRLPQRSVLLRSGAPYALLGIGTLRMGQWSFGAPALRNRRRPTLGYPDDPGGMSQQWRADLG
jgi:hypothetical protein